MKASKARFRLADVTPAAALAAPFLIFVFLYVLMVQPQSNAANDARARAVRVSADLQREQNKAPGVVEAIRMLATSPSIGATDLSIETRTPTGAPVPYTPVTVTFLARYDQVTEFLSKLPSLSARVDVRSIDVRADALSPQNFVRATATLFVFPTTTARQIATVTSASTEP